MKFFVLALACSASWEASAATFSGAGALPAEAQAHPLPRAFPDLLAAWQNEYHGFSAPLPPSRAELVLHCVMLLALTGAVARALPRRRRSQARLRDQAARAAVEMSRIR